MYSVTAMWGCFNLRTQMVDVVWTHAREMRWTLAAADVAWEGEPLSCP